MAVSGAPQGWSASFSTAATKHFENLSTTVVPVGSASDAPAVALLAALRMASRPVTEAPRWRNAADWPDDKLVTEAVKATGAARVAIVRASPRIGAGPPLATVAIYSDTGDAKGSFFVRMGEPFVESDRAVAANDEEGLQDDITHYRPVDEKLVRARYLHFEEKVLLSDGAYAGDVNWPLLGEQAQRISWEEFYRIVGRQDVAKRISDAGATRLGLGLSAGGLVLLSLIVGAISSSALSIGVGVVVVTVGLLGGAVLALLAWATVADGLEMTECRRLAEDYNKRLARGEVKTADASPFRLNLTAGPAASGFTLSARF